MEANCFNFYLSVGSTVNIDDEDREILARELMQDLNELDYIVSVEIASSGKPPDGAKGFSIDFETLIVKMAETGGVSTLITTLGSWLLRDKSRTLKLQINDKSLEVTGLSKAEQADLIQWFKVQTGLQLDS